MLTANVGHVQAHKLHGLQVSPQVVSAEINRCASPNELPEAFELVLDRRGELTTVGPTCYFV
eukprot:CAMPEP_0198349014 /NCGR_PEP_ID=MMETSP1450-20131203/92194_1 /TAXON_ID=753684 ORGANISM="Madagascaria erythrocladiodes, Strain CCMP3234" /NCGR_SAMPLE_ID=MMETSP1450 /ASSEMBLY_ACC=CAM_ASM_001115 /LENGTH=61 /DNA_ID=CAMNT_0044054661 /DNA_START=125 /DNA_END=306 /DNA_ORIENTATION=+